MAEQWTPGAVAALRKKENLPFVRADASGNIVEFNARFAEVYGGQKASWLENPFQRSCRPVSESSTTPALRAFS